MPAEREWNIELLTAAEEGRRNRRTIDGILLAVAVLLACAAAAIATSAPEHDKDLAQALTTVLGWAAGFWRTAFVGSLLMALAIVVAVLLNRRWALARDLLLALLAVVGVGLVLGGLVESDWFVIEPHVWSRWGFPELRLAAVTAVVTVAGPELVRPVRLLAFWLVGLAALGAVVIDAALPSDAQGALALGLGAGLLVRLAFGTAAGVPSGEQVRLALASLGVEVDGLKPSARQRIGSAAYVAVDRAGRPLKARVLGRDAQDTQMLVRRWRTLAYRDPPRSVAVGRLEQVEHEALATLLAAQAGVRVPEVVTAALGPDGEALVVTREPDADSLEVADEVSDETLGQLWDQAARLHKAGVSHGRLNLSNVVLVEDGPVLLDLSAATLGAPQSAIDIDVAELLVACTVLAGPDRALTAALGGVGKDAVGTALPYLQRAALTPHVRDLARTHEVALKDLRQAAATATGREKPPELQPLRRVSAKKLLMTALIGFAAYGIITQLADIGFGTIADELRSADVAWVVVALILAQLTFVGSGISVRGTVLEPLPLLPCVVLQSAIKFINLTVPSSAGRIAMLSRVVRWRVGLPWYVIALGLPTLLSLATAGLNYLLGAPTFVQVGSLTVLDLVLFVLVVGEELGWRGYALPRLLEKRSPLIASLILGVLWGLWHLPTFLVPGTPQYGLPLVAFVLLTVEYSILMTWVFLHTVGSVLIATLFHGAINLSQGLFLGGVEGATRYWLLCIVYGVAAIIVGVMLGLRSRRNLMEESPSRVEAGDA